MFREYDTNLPLLSIHIPKCGGTSVARLLIKWFGRSNFYEHYPSHEESAASQTVDWESLKPPTCIHGHFDRCTGHAIEDKFPRATQFITFVRDPLHQLISEYQYKKSRIIKGYQFWDMNRDNLPESANHFLEDAHSKMLNHFPIKVTEHNFETVLRSFVYVGLFEKFDSSCRNLARRLRQPIPWRIPHHNQNFEPDDSIDPMLIEKVKSRHPLEYAVYNYIKDRNHKRITLG